MTCIQRAGGNDIQNTRTPNISLSIPRYQNWLLRRFGQCSGSVGGSLGFGEGWNENREQVSLKTNSVKVKTCVLSLALLKAQRWKAR